MTEEEKKIKQQVQTDDIYRSFGQFVLGFELLVLTMRIQISSILSMNGLKNSGLSNIIVTDLTASPLKSMLEAMIYEVSEFNEQERRIIKNIFVRTQILIEARNDKVHGTHFVGFVSTEQTEFDVVSGFKLTRGKKGSGIKNLTLNSTILDELINECDNVKGLISQLGAVILTKHSIVKNFIINSDGHVFTLKQAEKNSN